MRALTALVLALGSAGRLLAGGASTDSGLRLRLEPTDWQRISLLPAEPRGVRIDLERDPPQAAAQRAAAVGSLRPGRVWIHGAIGRIAESAHGHREVFWTFGNRMGRAYWPPDAGSMDALVALAEQVDALAGPDPTAALEALVRSQARGGWLEIQWRDASLLARLACGPSGETDARRELEIQQARDQARLPLRGLRAPAWRSTEGAPRAWMVAGRVLFLATGEGLEATLRLAGSRLEPIPVPGTPDGPR